MQNARIVLFFFLATIIGTLVHECGHYIAGLLVGFNPVLHYASTGYGSNYSSIYRLPDFELRDKIFLWGGSMQTMLTGIIGLSGLMFLSRKEEIDTYKTKHLFWITVAYFWSRELVISIGVLFTRLYHGYYPTRSDEYKLFITHPHALLLPVIVLFVLSSLILAWITFRLVKQHRLQLIGFGALGCIIAYPFWMSWIGPLLLPYP